MSFDERPSTPESLAQLESCERLLLRCFRRWTLGLARSDAQELEAAWNEIASSLGPARARQALDALSALVFRLAGAARRPINHHHACCHRLTADERRLLGLVAACQAGQEQEASRSAVALVATDQVSGVLDAARRLGRALATAELRLPNRLDTAVLWHACLVPDRTTIH